MQVEFKFKIDEKIITPFGLKGFIGLCAIGRDGKSYWVKTSQNSEWFFEDQLEPAKEEVRPGV